MKIVFWNLTPCSLVDHYQTVRGLCWFCLQDRRLPRCSLCIVIVVNYSCQTRIMCLYFVVWLVTFAHPLPFTGSLSPNPRGGYTSGPGYWSCDPFPPLPLHVVLPRAHSSPLRHNGPIRLHSAVSVFHVVTERVKRGNFHILSRGNAIMFLCVVQLKIPFCIQ